MIITTPNTSLRAFWSTARTVTVLSEAIDRAAPGATKAAEALARVLATAQKMEPAATQEDLQAALMNAAQSGVPLKNLAARAADVAVDERRAVVLRQAFERTASDLATMRDSALATGSDDILTALNHELLLALDQVDVNFAGLTATQAIERDVSNQWRRTQVALQRYREIREAQSMLARRLWEDKGSPFPSVDNSDRGTATAPYLANPAQVWDQYEAWVRFGYIEGEYEREDLTPPWPADGTSAQFATWVAGHPTARAWVPVYSEWAGRMDELIRMRDRGIAGSLSRGVSTIGRGGR